MPKANEFPFTLKTTGAATIEEINQAYQQAYGYQSSVPDPDNPGQMKANPETVEAHAQRRIAEEIGGRWSSWKRNQLLAEAARKIEEQVADSGIVVSSPNAQTE